MFSQIGQAIFDHQAILEASDFKMGLKLKCSGWTKLVT